MCGHGPRSPPSPSPLISWPAKSHFLTHCSPLREKQQPAPRLTLRDLQNKSSSPSPSTASLLHTGSPEPPGPPQQPTPTELSLANITVPLESIKPSEWGRVGGGGWARSAAAPWALPLAASVGSAEQALPPRAIAQLLHKPQGPTAGGLPKGQALATTSPGRQGLGFKGLGPKIMKLNRNKNAGPRLGHVPQEHLETTAQHQALSRREGWLVLSSWSSPRAHCDPGYHTSVSPSYQ